jgi:CheY-like chemotaxis protein
MENRGSILVIDDEPSVADALKIILESHGYLAAVAATGLEGIENARQIPFGLIITDLYLPDMTGFELLDTVRQNGTHGPVMIITAANTPEIFQEAKLHGAADVLFKPFSPSELLQLVDNLLTVRKDPGISQELISEMGKRKRDGCM